MFLCRCVCVSLMSNKMTSAEQTWFDCLVPHRFLYSFQCVFHTDLVKRWCLKDASLSKVWPISISSLYYSYSLFHVHYFENEMLVERVYVNLGAAEM